MIAMHFDGDFMFPIILEGSILCVDTGIKDRDRLHQRRTLVAHCDLGFKVARFQRISGSDLLVSANYKVVPVNVSNASKWKIFGEGSGGSPATPKPILSKSLSATPRTV